MIDDQTFKKINPNYAGRSYDDDEEEDRKIEVIPEDQLFSCWTTIKGFSFSCKKWGEIAIEHVQEIDFDSTA